MKYEASKTKPKKLPDKLPLDKAAEAEAKKARIKALEEKFKYWMMD
jgi:hypothetical protein